jgi:hypothetical protein
MGNLNSEYPTEQQIQEMYEAYKSGKPGAIAEVLRKRRGERKEAEAESAASRIMPKQEQQAVGVPTPATREPIKPDSMVYASVDQVNSLLERNAQLEDEKRSGFWYQVNESLHSSGDRLAWCIVFFVISIALALRFLPGGAAFFLSAMIAVGWTVLVDKKKR